MNHAWLHAGELLRGALALAPVILFLAALRALDSYKLVSARTVASALAAGALAAAVCYGINTVVFQQFPRYQDEYVRFGAPVVEESAKAVYWIFLIATARVAFMADSAICGFAIGAGFALVENITYLHLLTDERCGDLDIARVWYSHHARGRGGARSVDFGVPARESAMAWRASFRARPSGSDCPPLVVQSEPAVATGLHSGVRSSDSR